ncbi:superoxide dismutase, partial [Auriculariales sp. MPI-PUGE-AT-0066]
KAIAILSGPKVTGTVTLSQPTATGATYITGRISGLDGSALRGFHVHEFGDVSQGCMGAGGHFNPYSKDHGGPHDADRHVGEWSIDVKMSNQGGVVDLSIEDKLVQLNGPLTVLGRAIVIHSGTDDVGRGNNPASKQNGNAGGRDACGIIGTEHKQAFVVQG